MCFLQFIEMNKDVIECLFTLALIILATISVTVAFLCFRKIHFQFLFSEWSTLTAALYNLERLKFEVMLVAQKEQDQKIGKRLDELTRSITNCANTLDSKIKSLEKRLKHLL